MKITTGSTTVFKFKMKLKLIICNLIREFDLIFQKCRWHVKKKK